MPAKKTHLVSEAAEPGSGELDRTPVIGPDGRQYVSDDISAQAVKHGYAPDIQPRSYGKAHVTKNPDAD